MPCPATPTCRWLYWRYKLCREGDSRSSGSEPAGKGACLPLAGSPVLACKDGPPKDLPVKWLNPRKI